MKQLRFCFRLRICVFSLLLVSVFSVGCGRSANERAGISVKENEHDIEIENGRVRLVLSFDSSIVRQNYFAKNNGEWKLVAESFSGSGKTDSNVMPLYKK